MVGSSQSIAVSRFFSGLLNPAKGLPLDAALKGKITDSLAQLIRTNPDRGEAVLQELLDTVSSLQERNRQLEEMAVIDPLTGAYNRYHLDRLMEEIDRDMAAAPERRNHGNHYLMMIDLDHFKDINDTYGHAAGDAALRYVSDFLSNKTRKTDAICRLGGDEFIVVLKNSTEDGAVKKIQEISEEFNKMSFCYEGKEIPVRASIGTGEIVAAGACQDVLKTIDRKMYEAKKTKRAPDLADYKTESETVN